jgi:3-oxoacyl-ACP reductase-like protein
MIKTTGLLLISLSVVAGCKKKDAAESAPAGTDAPAATAAAAAPSTAAPGEVASYPNMTPEGGRTVRLLQPFVVHQAAENGSATLAKLGVGTLVNLKGSLSNWMLIDWPSGVGQLSPGWIELRSNDNRVQQVVADAGTPVVDAGTPVDAGRPRVRIPRPR